MKSNEYKEPQIDIIHVEVESAFAQSDAYGKEGEAGGILDFGSKEW